MQSGLVTSRTAQEKALAWLSRQGTHGSERGRAWETLISCSTFASACASGCDRLRTVESPDKKLTRGQVDLGAEGDRLEHFLQFLQYMYTGGCRLDGANCMPLLRLSNFYEVCMPQQYQPCTRMCPAPCALAVF